LSDGISDADLTELAVVLSSYQEVLGRVKAQLSALGYSATGRVKTTRTLTDKLRRIHGFELSRMQDLAGARITVNDLAAQDIATEKIQVFYEDQGCPCRAVDRRADPRLGYRAMHLIVRVDEMPVEIQIRTEMQDSWAQIVERLGDRWGRAIRYGGEPENPDSLVRSGDLVLSRREAMDTLLQLSEAFAIVEGRRAAIVAQEKTLRDIESRLADVVAKGPEVIQETSGKVKPGLAPHRDRLVAMLSLSEEQEDSAFAASVPAGPDMSGGDMTQLLKRCYALQYRELRSVSLKLQESEQRLRGILQLIADATDEGE
jgi:ppGpp synthetase/RelA/SpoT-type nucleotidyltranferase